jgi:hypothetical protein
MSKGEARARRRDTHLVESSLVRELLTEHTPSSRFLVPGLLSPRHVLPHPLGLRHLAPALNLVPLALALDRGLLVARQSGELSQTPGFESFRWGVV